MGRKLKMDYSDELEQLGKQKQRVKEFIELIRFASLPFDLEKEETRKAKDKIMEIEFFEQELSPIMRA